MSDIAAEFKTLLTNEWQSLTDMNYPDGVAWMQDLRRRTELWLDGESVQLVEARDDGYDARNATNLKLVVLTARFVLVVGITKEANSIYSTASTWELARRAEITGLEVEIVEPKSRRDWLVSTATFAGITDPVTFADAERRDVDSEKRREIFHGLRDDLYPKEE
jgi:hypothetical protein